MKAIIQKAKIDCIPEPRDVELLEPSKLPVSQIVCSGAKNIHMNKYGEGKD